MNNLYSGKQKIKFRNRLGDSWKDLADYFEINSSGFQLGNEADTIWEWLCFRERLSELPEALIYIVRGDIVSSVFTANEESLVPEVLWTKSPYPGLRDFKEEESPIFFGREKQIEKLIDLLQKSRFVAVVGASGSGKSSLVRAGVIPEIKKTTTSKSIESLRFTPGGGFTDNPFNALAAALAPGLEKGKLKPRDVAEKLYKQGCLAELGNLYLQENAEYTDLLLFLDQFEELFTISAEHYRDRFIRMLNSALASRQLKIIMTVRADFVDRCLKYAPLAERMNTGQWNLAAPDHRSLIKMITCPAEAAGLEFEEGLPERILEETAAEPGGLALMAFALEKLYLDCRPERTLTERTYNSFGGVKAIIGRQAEETYQNLDERVKQSLGEVFSYLVTVDPEKGTPTRKRELLQNVCKSEPAKNFVDAFIDQRLLVTRYEQAVGNILEVAHEALLTRWPLLNDWIVDRFDDFCLLRQVHQEANEWQRNGCLKTHLWPHERLIKVYQMQRRLQPELTAQQQDFIRPERERLIEELKNSKLSHQERERIGYRLAEIDDPRPGVGLDANGLPRIVWCPVPPGKVVLENNAGEFMAEPCHISKFPVTWMQYRAFLKAADGYQNPDWWQGLQHDKNPGDQFRKLDNHPAENVSWYDAMAFCRWLTTHLGFEVRLPTEWEWQQAATRGISERNYPWGEKFNNKFANTYESGLNRTTAVGLYPLGISPVGALDMSGNVWEWCSNLYDHPENSEVSDNGRRMVRGGSWFFFQNYARSASRSYFLSFNRNFHLGFRLCCSSPIIPE